MIKGLTTEKSKTYPLHIIVVRKLTRKLDLLRPNPSGMTCNTQPKAYYQIIL